MNPIQNQAKTEAPPYYRVRASRLMLALSLLYAVFGVGVALLAVFGKGALGHALLSREHASPITVPTVILAETLLFALPALLLFFGSRAVMATQAWGRVAGMLVAGFLPFMFFPYGAMIAGVLFWSLLAGWELPKPIVLPTPPRPTVPPISVKGNPANAPAHMPWLTNRRMALGKRAKPRSR
jgi:hypothetical protein